MKRQAENVMHHRGIGGEPTNCRQQRRADHKISAPSDYISNEEGAEKEREEREANKKSKTKKRRKKSSPSPCIFILTEYGQCKDALNHSS